MGSLLEFSECITLCSLYNHEIDHIARAHNSSVHLPLLFVRCHLFFAVTFEQQLAANEAFEDLFGQEYALADEEPFLDDTTRWGEA